MGAGEGRYFKGRVPKNRNTEVGRIRKQGEGFRGVENRRRNPFRGEGKGIMDKFGKVYLLGNLCLRERERGGGEERMYDISISSAFGFLFRGRE